MTAFSGLFIFISIFNSFNARTNRLNILSNLIKNRVSIKAKYGFLKRPLEKLLSKGKIVDEEEIVRDFDGWSWNVVTEEIENYICNIVYQNIKILVLTQVW